jgi:hypothetical protein
VTGPDAWTPASMHANTSSENFFVYACQIRTKRDRYYYILTTTTTTTTIIIIIIIIINRNFLSQESTASVATHPPHPPDDAPRKLASPSYIQHQCHPRQ